jgi:hypothetical protein
MTSSNRFHDSIPPLPLVNLTIEQEFKMRQIEDALSKTDIDVKDIITVFISLQHQNFVLANNLKQLLKQW